MATLLHTFDHGCPRCGAHCRDEVVFVLDAPERRDLARRAIAGRIRHFTCPACDHTEVSDLPLLVYRPDDGGVDALLWIGGSEDQSQQEEDRLRLVAWLYAQLGMTFDDAQPGLLPIPLEALPYVLCRSVTNDLDRPDAAIDLPDAARAGYLEMLAQLRADRS
jgi:hypothetical protein